MKKSEILKNKRIIDKVFSSKETKTIYKPPFCVKFLDTDSETKTLITVPKKKFKRAVDRNSVKRKIKAIYDDIATYENKYVVIIYASELKTEYITMKDTLKSIFKKIS